MGIFGPRSPGFKNGPDLYLFPEWLIESLDREVSRFGVTRRSMIMAECRERLVDFNDRISVGVETLDGVLARGLQQDDSDLALGNRESGDG